MRNRPPKPAEVGLRYLSTAYWIRKAVDGQMADNGPSLARTKVLQVLDRRGSLRQTALATELGLAARSITQAVEAMERDGLVERHPDPEDQRAKLVTLTAEGSAALVAGTAAGEDALRRTFSALTPAQRTALDEILNTLDASAG
jgi:DNA-binding MarR family transcriptional regulator